MESEFGFRVTKKAEADLDDIVSYIAIELSNSQAELDFVDKLQKMIGEVQLFPESGSLVNNEFLSGFAIKKKLVGNYIMYYLPDFEEKEIIVLRIIYGKRNMDEVFRKIET